jgi:hypothetical protein
MSYVVLRLLIPVLRKLRLGFLIHLGLLLRIQQLLLCNALTLVVRRTLDLPPLLEPTRVVLSATEHFQSDCCMGSRNNEVIPSNNILILPPKFMT